MQAEVYRSTWRTYAAAWEDVSSAERATLLERSLADDCVYSDPLAQCRGRAEILAYIEQFRSDMPGASFDTHTIRAHHEQSLASWILHDGTGAAGQPGDSYGLYGADGRITNIAGFFEVPAEP